MKMTYKMVPENMAIGAPRFSISQTSAMVPPTLHMGAEAARPAIMRATTRVAAFFARALGRVKMKYRKRLMQYIGRRPNTSDSGARNRGLRGKGISDVKDRSEKRYGPKTESHDEACHCEIGDLLFNVKVPCRPCDATIAIKKQNG